MKSFLVEPICNNTHGYIVHACVLNYGVVIVVVFNGRCFYKRSDVCTAFF